MSLALQNTFKVKERLKKTQDIETLFQVGKAFSSFPVRCIWRVLPLASEDAYPAAIGFAVPKKKLRRAVDRNRVKRLLREAWRMQKKDFYTQIPQNQKVHLFFIYQAPEVLAWEQAYVLVTKLIEQLLLKIKAATA